MSFNVKKTLKNSKREHLNDNVFLNEIICEMHLKLIRKQNKKIILIAIH